MGSEHSSHQTRNTSFDDTSVPRIAPNVIRRQHTIANPGIHPLTTSDVDSDRPGSTSPGPSVCSDTDLPYISYTVNRPIGDSPKVSKAKLKSAPSGRKAVAKVRPKSAHNIVVVKPAALGPMPDKDADIVRLQSIPMFLPIMRATLNLPAARDPEVLERLDAAPLQKLCARYQTHLHVCANQIAGEQNALALRVREVDADVSRMLATSVERQKHVARSFEKLRKAHELSNQLNRCHHMLNLILESMDALNGLLDIDERLEPFVWTTG